jgi:hypothetical protein
MIRTKRYEPLTEIDFAEDDYIQLVGWTSRAIWNDMKGLIHDEFTLSHTGNDGFMDECSDK